MLRRLRAYPPTRDVPVVLVSGELPDLARERLCELGVAAFLDKPYSIGDLIAVVKSLLKAATY